jgi:hypothetical protein
MVDQRCDPENIRLPEFAPISKSQAERLRKVLKQRLAKKRASRSAHPVSPAPRYDEVYFRGLEWLDSLAGEPIEPSEGRLICQSREPNGDH